MANLCPPITPTYRELLSEWLTDQPWTFFATLTTPYALSVPSARRLMERTASCWRSITSDLTLVYAIETNPSRQGHHVHALVRVPEAFTSPHHFTALLTGYRTATGNASSIIELSRFDATKGGANYITKHFDERGSDRWDILHG